MSYCSHCGQILESDANYCSGCGNNYKNSTFNPESAGDPKAGDKERVKKLVVEYSETTFYSDETGVRITPTRLIVPGKTSKDGQSIYSMANITSFKSEKDESSRIIGVIVALVGLGLIGARYNGYLSTDSWNYIGFITLIVGILLAVFSKPVYHLKIACSSGEVDALQLNKKTQFDRILAAINEALVKRG
jgi:hypothetical protein